MGHHVPPMPPLSPPSQACTYCGVGFRGSENRCDSCGAPRPVAKTLPAGVRPQQDWREQKRLGRMTAETFNAVTRPSVPKNRIIKEGRNEKK